MAAVNALAGEPAGIPPNANGRCDDPAHAVLLGAPDRCRLPQYLAVDHFDLIVQISIQGAEGVSTVLGFDGRTLREADSVTQTNVNLGSALQFKGGTLELDLFSVDAVGPEARITVTFFLWVPRDAQGNPESTATAPNREFHRRSWTKRWNPADSRRERLTFRMK